jgi:hypothetical protein
MTRLIGRAEAAFSWEDGASTRECEFPQQSRIFARLHRHKRPKAGLPPADPFFIDHSINEAIKTCMPSRPFRVGRSVTGLGLFATRPIKRRTRIAEYKGPLLTGKVAERAVNSGNRYLFEINSRWTIDGKSRKNLARYANHSCNPNAEPIIVKRRVFISALRAIKPGEEIVYDYGNDYLRNVIGKPNCKCGRCRRRRAKKARMRRQKSRRKTRRRS